MKYIPRYISEQNSKINISLFSFKEIKTTRDEAASQFGSCTEMASL